MGPELQDSVLGEGGREGQALVGLGRDSVVVGFEEGRALEQEQLLSFGKNYGSSVDFLY